MESRVLAIQFAYLVDPVRQSCHLLSSVERLKVLYLRGKLLFLGGNVRILSTERVLDPSCSQLAPWIFRRSLFLANVEKILYIRRVLHLLVSGSFLFVLSLSANFENVLEFRGGDLHFGMLNVPLL